MARIVRQNTPAHILVDILLSVHIYYSSSISFVRFNRVEDGENDLQNKNRSNFMCTKLISTAIATLA